MKTADPTSKILIGISVAAILVIIGAGAYYFFFLNKPKTTSSPSAKQQSTSPVPIPTLGQQLGLKNSRFKYSLNYPESWKSSVPADYTILIQSPDKKMEILVEMKFMDTPPTEMDLENAVKAPKNLEILNPEKGEIQGRKAIRYSANDLDNPDVGIMGIRIATPEGLVGFMFKNHGKTPEQEAMLTAIKSTLHFEDE